MTMRRSIALLLLSGLFSCKESPPATMPFELKVSRPVQAQAPDGSTRVTFEVTAQNDGAKEQSVYLFVAAYNMAPKPPTRGIWPPEAEAELNNSSHELIVGQYKRGFEVKVPAGGSFETYGSIKTPAGRSGFNAYQVVIYDAEGRKVRDRYGEL